MNDDELRHRLGELADNQPWVVDWTTGVRRQVARRRRRQAAVLAGATALVIAAGTGIGLAVTGPGGSQTLRVLSPPSGPPSPSAAVQATPSPTPSLTCSTSGEQCAAIPEPAKPGDIACVPATRASCPGTAIPDVATATPTASAPATMRPTPSASPSGTTTTIVNHVTVTVSVSPAQPVAGQTATVTVRAHGSAGFVAIDRVDFSDGTVSMTSGECVVHQGTPSPAPRDDSQTLRHVWKQGGRFTVTAHAGTPCSPYKGSATGSHTVTVRAAESPSPTTPATPPA